MNVSFGAIFRTNVYLNSQKVTDEKEVNKITNLLARNLSGTQPSEKYDDLTRQQRIMLRMYDASYKIPESKKQPGNCDSKVSMVTVPQIGRFMVVGKKNNEEMSLIRNDSIGAEYYHNGQSMEKAYLDIFKNNAFDYIRSHSSPYEINIQAKYNPKGNMYISLIDFKKH